jgi:hypothetical protein
MEGRISGVVLMCPLLVDSRGVPEKYREHYKSYDEFADGTVLDKKTMDWFDGRSGTETMGDVVLIKYDSAVPG